MGWRNERRPTIEEEARVVAREVVQAVANKQIGLPDEEDMLEIDAAELEKIVTDLICAWRLEEVPCAIILLGGGDSASKGIG